MKAIIIDDERLARVELSRLLKNHPEIEIIAEASNVDEAIGKIESLKPDLIFLDIQMPGKTGFDLLTELTRTPKIIFTTAYDEFALKAFEFNALDYLLKPIDPVRLAKTVLHLSELKNPTQQTENRSLLTIDDQVFVKDGDHCWFVKLSTIRLFESEGNYVRVYFDNQRPLIFKSLNDLEDRLPEKVFFRANRKHIINLKCVNGIESWFNGGLKVKLSDGNEVEISRRQSQKFKDLMSL